LDQLGHHDQPTPKNNQRVQAQVAGKLRLGSEHKEIETLEGLCSTWRELVERTRDERFGDVTNQIAGRAHCEILVERQGLFDVDVPERLSSDRRNKGQVGKHRIEPEPPQPKRPPPAVLEN